MLLRFQECRYTQTEQLPGTGTAFVDTSISVGAIRAGIGQPGYLANVDGQITVDVPDVLAPKLQAQLQDLTDRLATFAPQHVMVEWVWGEETALADSLYSAYLASGGQSSNRDEAVQVGFRLARSGNSSSKESVNSASNPSLTATGS